MEFSFGIVGCAAWTPGLGGGPDSIFVLDEVASESRLTAPHLLRRRIGAIGQAALRVAWALPLIDSARYIFASRFGEFDRTLRLLHQIADGQPLSPADFSLSVHNALAGLLSISAKNGSGHTAIAGGTESFGFGLIEAAGCLLERPDQPVILVYYDATLPAGFPDSAAESAAITMALGLTLVPARSAARRIAMRLTHAGTVAPDQTDVVGAPAGEFLRLMISGAKDATVRGEQMIWSWHID